MNENTQKLPVSYWIISGLALFWNLLGVASYLGQAYMSDERLAELPEHQRLMLENTPAWATAAFAIAVFAGFIGCIALLLRRAWALPMFIISFLAVILRNIYYLFIANAASSFGIVAIIMTIAVIAISIFLIWYTRSTREKGWIS